MSKKMIALTFQNYKKKKIRKKERISREEKNLYIVWNPMIIKMYLEQDKGRKSGIKAKEIEASMIVIIEKMEGINAQHN